MRSVVKLIVLLVCITNAMQVSAAEPSRPYVVAHRGLLQHAPENTLAGFRACLELRIGFEFDVQKTKDGRLVCIHDDDLKRTTNGKRRVAEQMFDELRRLDAGGWFDPKFAGKKIPTIDEVLALLAEYPRQEVLVAVDLKSKDVEAEVVKLASKHAVLPRLIFIGRTIEVPAVRATLKSTSQEAKTSAVANTSDEFADALAVANSDWVYFRYLPPSDQVKRVHTAGKRAFIAGKTVAGNEPTNWKQAAEVGIDGILTDYALELSAQFRKPR